MTRALNSTRPQARLVTNADEREVLQPVQLVDTKTAITRSLADYIASLELPTQMEGRTQRFTKIFDVWAEPETVASFPSAVVYPVGDITYDPMNMSTTVLEIAPHVGIRRGSAAQMQVSVEIWTNDPEERILLSLALENAFNPVDWMAGFLLTVPYYFNARAQFCLKSNMYEDDGESAQKRWRKATFTLDAEIEQIVPVGRFPYLIPQLRSEVAS